MLLPPNFFKINLLRARNILFPFGFSEFKDVSKWMAESKQLLFKDTNTSFKCPYATWKSKNTLTKIIYSDSYNISEEQTCFQWRGLSNKSAF